MASSSRYVPDLSAFLGHCELNYLRLYRLWPLLQQQGQLLQQPVDQPWLLTLSLLGSSTYTSDLLLKLDWSVRGQAVTATMEVRLYHDARLAEVLAYQGSRRFRPRYEYPNPALLQVDEKQQLNLLLRDWLCWAQPA